MSDPGIAMGTLCWRANHNPFGSNLLGAAAPLSAWESLAGALGLPAPMTSPAHLLKARTTVTFGIAITIVP